MAACCAPSTRAAHNQAACTLLTDRLQRSCVYQVYRYEQWSTNELPHFEVGQSLEPSLLELRDGTTEPPKLLKEEELITLMATHGIGTDATIAEHISTIQKREYVP